MRRIVGAVLVLALVALVVGSGALFLVDRAGSGSRGPVPVPPPTTGAPAGLAPSADLAPFYHQHLAWSDCGDGHQCAKLRVPLDYADPGGTTIELALLRVPASGSRIGSLVVDPGGPGDPGTSLAAQGGQVFGQPLLDHFDIVGFDPRGTGGSSPVDCLSDSQLDAYIAEDPDPSTPAELATYRANQRALATGCTRLSGALAAHVSTVETVRDMDVLRAALGDRELDYLGFSYGTELGAVYAQLFPSRVGRFVLDGAVDPSLTSAQSDLQQAAGFQKALEAYVASCVASDVGCFLGKTEADALHTISALFDRLARQPLQVGDRQLTVGNAFYGVALSLYSRSLWLLLTTSLRSALGGDGSGLLQLSDLYSHRNADGTYADNTIEAFYTISCLDDPSSIPLSRVPSHYPAFEKASPVFGRVFAWSLSGCRGFTPRAQEPIPAIHGKGAAPIVVIGTTRDPATPYQWAVSLAHQLDSGVLLSRNGDGHTGYHEGNACVDDAVESYLVSDVVPADGTRC